MSSNKWINESWSRANPTHLIKQVDKNGKYLLGDKSNTKSSSEEEDVVQEDASEARGLQALAVHTKLTKEAIGLADESDQKKVPDQNEANEIAESVTVSTTAKSIDTTQSSLLQVDGSSEDTPEEVTASTEVASTENVQENSEEESSMSDDSINEPSEDKDGE